MSEDFRRHLKNNCRNLELEQILQFKKPNNSVMNRQYLKLINVSMTQTDSKLVDGNVPKLNEGQKGIYNEVVSSIFSGSVFLCQLFFLDAPGGTGKTFLLNLTTARVRMEKNISVQYLWFVRHCSNVVGRREN